MLIDYTFFPLIGHNSIGIVQWRYLFCCSELNAAFVGVVLRVFDEINFSHSFVERIFYGYVKSAVLSQQCTVTEFGEVWILQHIEHKAKQFVVL